jgi:hypothetical protein
VDLILIDTGRSVACLSPRQNDRGRGSLDGSLGGVLRLPSFPRRPVSGGPGLAAGVLAEALDTNIEWFGGSGEPVGFIYVQVGSCG